jgi:hypothetical protein
MDEHVHEAVVDDPAVFEREAREQSTLQRREPGEQHHHRAQIALRRTNAPRTSARSVGVSSTRSVRRRGVAGHRREEARSELSAGMVFVRNPAAAQSFAGFGPGR